MSAMEPAAPSGSWTHSFEEDGSDGTLYRPTQGFSFPPSRRGRETLEFDGAGQVRIGTPGPDDRPRLSSWTMTSQGANRYRLENGGMPAQMLEIVESAPDKLKVRLG